MRLMASLYYLRLMRRISEVLFCLWDEYENTQIVNFFFFNIEWVDLPVYYYAVCCILKNIYIYKKNFLMSLQAQVPNRRKV